MRTEKVYYGNAMMFRRFCSQCHDYALVIDNQYACCGRNAHLENVKKATSKRESTTYHRRRYLKKAQKEEILAHQNYQCLYCGISLRRKRVKIEFDHFVPFNSTRDNKKTAYVASCQICNRLKSNLIFNSILETRLYISRTREAKGLPVYDYLGGGYEIRKI